MPPRKQATLHDVARTAGVSVATASNALTGNRTVSPQAHAAVVEAADNLGYPKGGARRGDARRQTSTIGVIIPDITNPFYAEMARTFELQAAVRGWSINISDSGFDPTREGANLKRLVASTDGVILFPTRPAQSKVSELPDGHVPIVVCDEPLEAPGVGSVRSDNFGGGRVAAHHLVDRGGTVFAMIGGPGHLPTTHERREGFLSGLRDRGIPSSDVPVVGRTYGMDGGQSAMYELLHLDPRVDAVFVCTDMQAVGALFEAQQSGRNIPGDLMLCGFDGIGWTARTTPSLTTLEQDREGIVASAIVQLGQMMEGAPSETIILPVTLVERQSTSRP